MYFTGDTTRVSKEEREKLRRQQLKNIKRKFGLEVRQCHIIIFLKRIYIYKHYLLDVTNPFHRVALAQYRLNSHNLGIKTGRHTKPPKPQEQRLCLYCRNGCVDDETHFLTECDIHTETRQRFVSNIKSHIDGYEDLRANGKFVTVMRSSSAVVIKELAKFGYKAFQQRLHHV